MLPCLPLKMFRPGRGARVRQRIFHDLLRRSNGTGGKIEAYKMARLLRLRPCTVYRSLDWMADHGLLVLGRGTFAFLVPVQPPVRRKPATALGKLRWRIRRGVKLGILEPKAAAEMILTAELAAARREAHSPAKNV